MAPIEPHPSDGLPPSLLHPRLLGAFERVMPVLERLHRHRAVGLENIPHTGPVLVALHHTFATYDGILLARAIQKATGRIGVGLGDDLIFKMPGLRTLGWHASIRPANPENGLSLLRDGHLVFVAPGGMREGLRPTTEARQHRWGKRRGFIRLALEAQVPLVIAACPAGDDLYTVYESPLTKLAYKRGKLPVPFVRGWGPTPLPRPVALTHYFAPPITPPPLDRARYDAQVTALHAQACEVMDGLLARRD